MIRIFFLLFFLFVNFSGGMPLSHASEIPVFPAADRPAGKLFVGEKLVYSIRYFGVPIGRGISEVKEVVTLNGRPAYHIVARVHSNPVVDLIYKVRGEHHSYVDVEKLYSLRYQVQSAKDVTKPIFYMEMDHEKNLAEYHYLKTGSQKQVPMRSDSQDRLSCGFFFRTLAMGPEAELAIPVNTEGKNWSVKIKSYEVKPMQVKKIGKFEALEIEPHLSFISTLQKPGSVRAWISMDERRIPLQMRAKAPLVGEVTLTLVEYQAGKA